MIETEKIIYRDDTNTFEGYMCWDSSIKQPKPGVLISHTFWGQTDFDIKKATALAKLGYTGFAIDMYGKGKRPTTPEEAGSFMQELNDNRHLLLARITLALNTLKSHPQVHASKIGAIGFCFGGKCVLDLARSGTAIQGVVSFHGLYDPPLPVVNTKINTAVLILHGWEDPLASIDETLALTKELTEKKADWQLYSFGHTGHAFTNPKATNRKGGLFYHDTSSNRAWLAMCNFFEELFNTNGHD